MTTFIPTIGLILSSSFQLYTVQTATGSINLVARDEETARAAIGEMRNQAEAEDCVITLSETKVTTVLGHYQQPNRPTQAAPSTPPGHSKRLQRLDEERHARYAANNLNRQPPLPEDRGS